MKTLRQLKKEVMKRKKSDENISSFHPEDPDRILIGDEGDKYYEMLGNEIEKHPLGVRRRKSL